MTMKCKGSYELLELLGSTLCTSKFKELPCNSIRKLIFFLNQVFIGLVRFGSRVFFKSTTYVKPLLCAQQMSMTNKPLVVLSQH